MIVHRNGQGFFGVLLADAIKVKMPFDGRGFGNGEPGLAFLILDLKFAVEDVFAKDDAVVADENARPGNELAHFRLRFAAEAAQRDVGRTGHFRFMICDLRLMIANGEWRGALKITANIRMLLPRPFGKGEGRGEGSL
jgi:hypothetical protein